MATNFVQEGDVIDFVVPAIVVTSGDLVNIGPALSGVALHDGVEGDTIEVAIRGVFDVLKTAALVIAVGEEVYFNTTTKMVTKTKTDKCLGVATLAAAADDTTVRVVLTPKRGEQNAAESQVALVAQIATANGSDPATTMALANANKAKINELLTAMINAGVMASV